MPRRGGGRGHLDGFLLDRTLVDRTNASFNYRPEVRRLEQAYGRPTLWQYVTQERHLSRRRVGRHHYKYGTDRTTDELLSIVCSSLVNVEAMFEEHAFDCVVYATHTVPEMLTAMLEEVIKSRGGSVVCPAPARLGGRSFFKDTVDDRVGRVDREYERLVQTGECSEEAEGVLSDFRAGNVHLSYVGKRGDRRARLAQFKVQAARELSKPLRQFKYRSWRDDRHNPFYKDWYATQRMWWNARWIRSSPLFREPDGQPFVLFPMHIEPEQSILVYGPFHTNQFAVIQNVAQAVPAGVQLYVKDHAALLGNRTRSYYEKLARIPNVRLIKPEVSGRELILQSQGVVTISGTAGLEAMLHGRPAFTLGCPYYNSASPMVRHVESERQIAEQNEFFNQDFRDDLRIRQYVTAILRHSYDIDARQTAQGLASDHPEQHEPDYQVYLDALTRELAHRQEVAQVAAL